MRTSLHALAAYLALSVGGEVPLDRVLEGMRQSTERLQSGIVAYTVAHTDFADGLSQSEIEARVEEHIRHVRSARADAGMSPIDAKEEERLRIERRQDLQRAATETTHICRTGRFVFDSNLVNSTLWEEPAALQQGDMRVECEDRVTFDGGVAMRLEQYKGHPNLMPSGTIMAQPIAEGQISRRTPRSLGRYADIGKLEDTSFEMLGHERLDLGDCAILQSEGGTLRSWVCPELGFLIIREEQYESEGLKPIQVFELNEVKRSNGVHFPTLATYRSFWPDDGRPLWEAVFEFTSVELNVDVDPEQFVIDFPQGTQVTDFRTVPHLAYTVSAATDAVGEGLSDLVERSGDAAVTFTPESPVPEQHVDGDELAGLARQDGGSDSSQWPPHALLVACVVIAVAGLVMTGWWRLRSTPR